eukprot:m.93239 g.93239  ORF g.93239 m.93239 type:complete len:178 (+) comp13393_c0_seq1:163-696(+)
MLATARELKFEHQIESFNGYQVEGGEDWQQRWFGVLGDPDCKIVVAMLSRAYFKSPACIEEIKKAVSEKKYTIPVYLEDIADIIDTHFLGTDINARMDAGYLRVNVLRQNLIPPKDQGWFPGADIGQFKQNVKMLAERIQDVLGTSSTSASNARHVARAASEKVGEEKEGGVECATQ